MSDAKRTCPDEAALIGWLDEPGEADPSIEAHVAGCEACAGRVASLESVLAGVAAEPAMPDAAAMAAAREQIRAAIGSPGTGTVRRFPAWAWAPALAAAAIAALLVWTPGGETPPEAPAPTATVAEAPAGLAPVVAEAEAAAEAVVAAAAADPVGEDPEGDLALDDEAVESLDEIRETIPTLDDEDDYETTLLADRFASLSDEDQAAILDELSDLTFEL